MPEDLKTDPNTRPAILIVDDEPLVRDVLSRWLSAEGFVCRTAADGASAWQSLQQQPADLVTCNINMPGISGVELLRQIKGADPDSAVLMLTGCGETDTAIRALTMGACGYLLKPVKREELVFQVQQGLRGAKWIAKQAHGEVNTSRSTG
jgi:putative two-component system response regulator